MKLLFNISTSDDDYNRYDSPQDLDELLEGFDGLELSYYGEDPRGNISAERVLGFHMSYFYTFVDFWNGNLDEALKNFLTIDNLITFYGGTTRDCIVKRFKEDLKIAERYGAEYLVFHVSEATIEEAFKRKHHLNEDEVVKATIEILNEVFDDPKYEHFTLLLENLWQPGLNFLNPDIPHRFLEGINHKNLGFMLDTGHLMHTNLELTNELEGINYVKQILDTLDPKVIDSIRGIHLNQSITSEIMHKNMKNPPVLKPTFSERSLQLMIYLFSVDLHQPFTRPEVREIVDRINPEYLTFEFITDSKETLRRYLKTQRQTLGLD